MLQKFIVITFFLHDKDVRGTVNISLLSCQGNRFSLIMSGEQILSYHVRGTDSLLSCQGNRFSLIMSGEQILSYHACDD